MKALTGKIYNKMDHLDKDIQFLFILQPVSRLLSISITSGVFSRDNLCRIKDRVYVMQLDDKQTEETD